MKRTPLWLLFLGLACTFVSFALNLPGQVLDICFGPNRSDIRAYTHFGRGFRGNRPRSWKRVRPKNQVHSGRERSSLSSTQLFNLLQGCPFPKGLRVTGIMQRGLRE